MFIDSSILMQVAVVALVVLGLDRDGMKISFESIVAVLVTVLALAAFVFAGASRAVGRWGEISSAAPPTFRALLEATALPVPP